MKGQQRRPGRGMPFRNSARSASRFDLRATLRGLVMLVVGVLVVGGLVASSVVSRVFSARDEPSRVEEALARAMRRWATPASMRTPVNPVQPTAEVLAEALAHFADHCRTCHANDGSGDTAIRSRDATDGELFSIVEHGIRLTGMPGGGYGTPEGERERWGLVHFVRRLPKLTLDEIERMEALSPTTPAQWKEEEEARRFL